ALDALVAVVDDPGPSTAEQPAPAPRPAGGAVACSPGVVVGSAAPRRAHTSRPDTAAGDPGQELDRLRAARSAARGQVQRIRDATAAELGEQEAAVFDAHLLLVDDEDLVVDAERRVAGGEPAAAAWQSAVTRVEASFAGLPDPYLRARAADVRAVGDQVLGALSGDEQELDPVGVLVADDLTPAQAAGLDPARTVGVVLAAGSPTAHSAILLRARGVPAVVGAGPAVLDVSAETLVALDGSTGELHLHPDEATRAAFAARAAAEAGARRAALGQAATPARTRDGVDVLVGANLGSLDDARRAADSGADLAGLVRTEFLFLDRDAAPGVEEQEAAYLELAEALGGRRLTLRTLDVGGDKPLRYLPGPVEANPFLGVRGLRLSLARPGLLADQLLAVVRAAHRTPVSVMFPMVSTLAELTAARQVLTDAVARDGRPPPADLQVGMMVEVPAAALKTAAFAPHVDFFSIGTNDLTQYALAAERGAPALTELADAYDPGVLALVAAVCRGAGQALVAVCGELAADPRATGLLVGLGVRELSAAPAAVPAVKQAVRALDTGEAAGAAAAALVAPDAAAVRALRAAGPPASP
ncbi:MAG TPA: phosphoenolpyruvate--protein phosphotransferase, partial [Mycobacteriales bacterium]|nr:phosphoenolpyruvate--protein phosphotransferase [Mycobacteriales bacterium]